MILIFILMLIINILFNMPDLMNCIYNSLYIWFYNVYPSIFIFYNISNYLITNSLFNKVSKLFKLFIKFNSDKSYTILLINIFLGNPGTVKIINNSYADNEISEHDYFLLCDICFFMNPLFILSIINIKYYLIYLLSSFIYIKIHSILFPYNKYSSDFINHIEKKYSFISFTKSINDVIYILLNVACLITFFNILTNTICYFISLTGVENNVFNFFLSFLEISSGLNYLNNNNVNISLYILLICFQGICILMQSFSISNKKNISFLRYILKSFLSSCIRTSIFLLILTLFHI